MKHHSAADVQRESVAADPLLQVMHVAADLAGGVLHDAVCCADHPGPKRTELSVRPLLQLDRDRAQTPPGTFSDEKGVGSLPGGRQRVLQQQMHGVQSGRAKDPGKCWPAADLLRPGRHAEHLREASLGRGDERVVVHLSSGFGHCARVEIHA
ncbi:hypothetical protein [Streptomyces sp. NPDC102487]|uniref:hypothetical protein n=1 Tax=Streptomyces sp. NPDC102487 TaxID=3366182 RepID=UPI0037F4E80D